MALSQAYGGSPNYTVLSMEEYKKDMEAMGYNDKKVFDLRINVDDDLQLAELIATIKNIPNNKNAPNIVVSKSL